jgi:hypothetical protein
MTPQSNLMVVVPILESREEELRQMLSTMNLEPGVANPENPLLPFAELGTLHFARFVILEDNTRDDLTACGMAPASATKSLAFLCDFDGPRDVFLRDLVVRADSGLRTLFSCCQPAPGANLSDWLEANNKPASAAYVNWIGRTIQQVREESALYDALVPRIDSMSQQLNARQVWSEMRQYVKQEQASGRLLLTPPESTPVSWQIKNLVHCIAVPVLLLLFLPLILLYLPIFLIQLRLHEISDPVIAPRPTIEHAYQLATLEDRIVTNQFSAYGNIKPGPFRRWTITAVFFAIDYTARHIYNRGFLARVVTIQFARWVFLDNNTRAFFASNYDGSLEAYMGDFINKVAWGLNVVFSNGLGYPRTNWLIEGGAKDELTFKDYLRRHQLPTQVWYNAAPGVTAHDKERNSRIREGLEKDSISDAELKQWIRLFG